MTKKGPTPKLTPLQKSTLESYCDMCFTYFRKSQPKPLNEGLEILLCSKCSCKTHRCCYDLEANEVFVTEILK